MHHLDPVTHEPQRNSSGTTRAWALAIVVYLGAIVALSALVISVKFEPYAGGRDSYPEPASRVGHLVDAQTNSAR